MSRTWVLDLDNTLYPRNSGFFARINQRIDRYMEHQMGLPGAVIPKLREDYRRRFGVTLGGLIAEHRVDPEQYLRYVHDVPVARYLDPDPALVAALEALAGRKVVFTNGSTGHARAVLARLGLNAQIDGIFDIAFMDYVPKPFFHGYRKLLLELAVAPASCWMVDDLTANLDTGRELGMTTVLVGPEPQGEHRHVRRAADLVGLVGGVVDRGAAPA
ncbi:MAG: pyrimidine 5'-nucleotidase [Deferrisomatales bacterium]|nr:pyrimidine 5'-nucleotidase [Deferrisomatales bacterium]